MKKMALLMFCLLIGNSLFSQEQAIKITNQLSKKEIVIKENKRIKIKTVDGKRISGRFKIENNSIIIEDEQIALADIAYIKRHPLLVSILTSSVLIYAGVVLAGAAVLVGVLIDSSAYLLTIPAAGLIFTGIKSPNFSRKFKTANNWTLETIAVPQ